MLIVDDEESVRRALRMTLEHEGFIVEEAASGDEALTRWGLQPSVIVSDNKMPGLSGLDIALHLKERVQISVVIFSGHVDENYGTRRPGWEFMSWRSPTSRGLS